MPFARYLERIRDSLFSATGIQVTVHRRRRHRCAYEVRYEYQKQFVRFDIQPGDRVLDVGSGGDPFPHATVLIDRFLGMSSSRTVPLATDNKPLAIADVHCLPFPDRAFDFVYCAHVLEVIENPLNACSELMRVGKRGFIETPTAGKDILFAWTKESRNQRWQVVANGQSLCFFEYSPRELEGVRSAVWRDLVFSQRQNPIQNMFEANQDVFNVMFTWHDRFSVFVFRLDGTIETLNTVFDSRSPELVMARRARAALAR